MLKRQRYVFKVSSFVITFQDFLRVVCTRQAEGKDIIKKKKTYDTFTQMNNKVHKNILNRQCKAGFCWKAEEKMCLTFGVCDIRK